MPYDLCFSNALERLWDVGSEEPDGAILAIPVSDTLKLGLVDNEKMTCKCLH